MDTQERKICERLNFMKNGVLYNRRGIRFDVSCMNLNIQEKEELRGEGLSVSGNDVILSIILNDNGFPSLKLSNSNSSLVSDFEQTVFDRHRDTIISAAQKLHLETEGKQFKVSQLVAQKEGFMLSKVEGHDCQLSYVIQGIDPDLGMTIVQTCKRAVVLKAISGLRDEYADSVRFHYANANYVAVDSRNFQILRRELLVETNMLKNSRRLAVNVRTLLNECVFVKLSLSDLGFVSNSGNRKLRVIEKDSDAHIKALKSEFSKLGFKIQKMNTGLYNIYKVGTFNNPIIVNKRTASELILSIKDFTGVKISA